MTAPMPPRPGEPTMDLIGDGRPLDTEPLYPCVGWFAVTMVALFGGFFIGCLVGSIA